MSLRRERRQSLADRKLSLRVASCRPPGRFCPAPKSTRRQKAAVRAIEKVGVFRPYIYPNRCMEASALPFDFPVLSAHPRHVRSGRLFHCSASTGQIVCCKYRNGPLMLHRSKPCACSSVCRAEAAGQPVFSSIIVLEISSLWQINRMKKEIWCAAEYDTMQANSGSEKCPARPS